MRPLLASLLFAFFSTKPCSAMAQDSHGLAPESATDNLTTSFQIFPNGLFVRVGIERLAGVIREDILFLPGFGDRLDNHGPLLAAGNAAGFRVISFDYPSYSETTDRGLDIFSMPRGPFQELAALARAVEVATREDRDRPRL